MRQGILLAALLVFATNARAEGQLKPFLGVTFGGGTNLVGDLEQAVGKPKQVLGISTTMIGEVFGVEADLGYVPGFFQAGRKPPLVLKSSLTTLTGNVLMALPRKMSEFTLRPYVVGGAGFMHTSTKTFAGVLALKGNVAAVDVGGGVTGFVTRKVGVSWDVRHFQSIHGKTNRALTIDGNTEELSFWRANMALAFRY